MSKHVSSVLTSEAKYYCDYAATANVTAALDVFDFFCSAAENKVVTTVTESASQFYPTASSSSSSSSATAIQTSADEQATAAGNGSSGGISKAAPIASGIVGGVAGLALIGAVVQLLRRRRRKAQAAKDAPLGMDEDGGFMGKSELAANQPLRAGGSVKPELGGGIETAVIELSPDHASTPELPNRASTAQHDGHGRRAREPQELVSPGSASQPSPRLNGQPVYEFPAQSLPASSLTI